MICEDCGEYRDDDDVGPHGCELGTPHVGRDLPPPKYTLASLNPRTRPGRSRWTMRDMSHRRWGKLT